jgi:hypothetical protein
LTLTIDFGDHIAASLKHLDAQQRPDRLAHFGDHMIAASLKQGVDIGYLQAAHLCPTHTCGVERHQHGAVVQIAGGIDQPSHFIWGQISGSLRFRLGIGMCSAR